MELFRGMMIKHNLIAYRDDRAEESQPIAFTGERWRDYIPILVPWSVCVRERLPPGSVAVLINRAHPFTDLVLTVDKSEDHLLSAIDGKRTIGEILVATGNEHNESRCLKFFERLWCYDQIVIDASARCGENNSATTRNPNR